MFPLNIFIDREKEIRHFPTLELWKQHQNWKKKEVQVILISKLKVYFLSHSSILSNSGRLVSKAVCNFKLSLYANFCRPSALKKNSGGLHDIDLIICTTTTCYCVHWNGATYWNSCGKDCIHVWLNQPSNHRELLSISPLMYDPWQGIAQQLECNELNMKCEMYKHIITVRQPCSKCYLSHSNLLLINSYIR
jgi:hypothetical protein